MMQWHNDDEASRLLARIDLTPMIGLLAALLALFALLAPATQMLPLRPVGMCGPPVDWFGRPPRDVRIDVDASGGVSMDGARIDPARLAQAVDAAQHDPSPPYFHLHVARQARYQAMVSLLDVLVRHNARYFMFES